MPKKLATRVASIGLGVLVLLLATGVRADEIQVLSAAAVQGPATALAERFTRETGHRVRFEFATAGQVDDNLAAGARPDIVISVQGRIAAKAPAPAAGRGLVRDLGTTKVGVAVRAGAPRPDVSSTAAFRESLLRAKTIAYSDPGRGGTSGIHFAKVIDGIGLRDALAGRIVLAANGLEVARKVASGEVELGVTQTSEILHVDATIYVGPIPDALQSATTYTAWVSDPGNQAAQMFVDAMTSENGRALFRAEGFD